MDEEGEVGLGVEGGDDKIICDEDDGEVEGDENSSSFLLTDSPPDSSKNLLLVG